MHNYCCFLDLQSSGDPLHFASVIAVGQYEEERVIQQALLLFECPTTKVVWKDQQTAGQALKSSTKTEIMHS
jgi:hypothetical protein